MRGKCYRCGAACVHALCESCAEFKRQVGRKISKAVKEAWARRGTMRTEPERAWRNFATRAVNTAIRMGFLPKLDGSYLCVDCGRIATVYEHRDYARVLDVVPVCQSCNLRRPPAVMPRPRTFVRFRKKD